MYLSIVILTIKYRRFICVSIQERMYVFIEYQITSVNQLIVFLSWEYISKHPHVFILCQFNQGIPWLIWDALSSNLYQLVMCNIMHKQNDWVIIGNRRVGPLPMISHLKFIIIHLTPHVLLVFMFGENLVAVIIFDKDFC